MFGLFKGKMMMMMDKYYDASVIRELCLFIDHYVNELTHRIQILQASGKSILFPLPPAVGNVNPAVIVTAASVTNHIRFYYHIRQYQYLNMSVNQQACANFNDLIHHQKQFQYQNPTNFYDQNLHNQDMNTDLNHNQYPNVHQPFMNQLMAQSQQMSYDQELASITSMDNNYNLTHQLPITSRMPFTTTTTNTADLSTHSINNNLWSTRIGLE